MASLTARMRFLYTLNIVVTGALAAIHLLAPAAAARLIWSSASSGANEALSPPLALPMLGSWWAAVAVLSLLGLQRPIEFSPVFLGQFIYKLAFLGSSVLPLALAGRWSTVPTASVAFYTAFLIPLMVCTPWAHLLAGKSTTGAGRGKGE